MLPYVVTLVGADHRLPAEKAGGSAPASLGLSFFREER